MAPRALLLAAVVLSACAAPAETGPGADAAEATGGDPLRSWAAAEAARLSATAATLGERGDAAAAELAAVAGEAEAGRALYAASRLPGPRLRLDAAAYQAERGPSIADLDALAAEAERVAAELDRLETVAAAALPGRSAAVRALADAAWVRGRAYRRAAVAYARVTSLEAGLFYLGAARSLLASAAELAAVPTGPPAAGGSAAPPAAALEAELAELDRRVVVAYRAPGAEVERHADFIALNAEIKEARDLLAAGRSAGALLATLEAHRRLEEVLDAGAGPDAAELRRQAAGFRRRVEAAPWDASLGGLVLESAESALATDAPGPADLRRARAVLVHVLPRYFELHEETP